MKRFRPNSEVNAGSMADIAFLLLIFFLVTTTILQDQGILTRLPPMPEDDQVPLLFDQEYVLNIAVNKNNEVLFEKERINSAKIKNNAVDFISSRYRGVQQNKTIVALSCDRAASYAAYIDVYDQLKQAYAQLWEEQSRRTYKKPYRQLTKKEQKQVRDIIPLVISESEPVVIK